jgi:hypothetical protein
MASDGLNADPDNEFVHHLEAALDAAADSEVRYHVRQALQHHILTEDHPED